jgi:hypothetical protein
VTLAPASTVVPMLMLVAVMEVALAPASKEVWVVALMLVPVAVMEVVMALRPPLIHLWPR